MLDPPPSLIFDQAPTSWMPLPTSSEERFPVFLSRGDKNVCLEVVTSRLTRFEGRWDKQSRGPEGNGLAPPLALCWHEPGEARSRTRVSSSGTYLSMSSQAWEVALERREREPGQSLRIRRRGEAKGPEIAEYVFIECVLLLSLL